MAHLYFARRRILSARLFSTQSNKIPFYGLPTLPVQQQAAADAAKSPVKRLQLTIQQAVTAWRDPTRADAVAAVGELSGAHALQNMLSAMQNNKTGKLILKNKPIVTNDATVQELIKQAKEYKNNNDDIYSSFGYDTDITFGQAYGRYLLQHSFDPDGRDPVKFLDTILDHKDDDDDDDEYNKKNQLEHKNDLVYVMLRYRQCHDFWHALTGLPPTVLGELALKWLELYQTQLPVTALACTVGTLRLQDEYERDLLWNIYLPWAQQQKVKPYQLMNVYYEQEYDTPLVELQQRLNLQPAPMV